MRKLTKIVLCILNFLLILSAFNCNTGTNGASMEKYQISFDANGGTGKMDSIKLVDLKSNSLPDCEFTRDGYDFCGWSLSKDGEVIFKPGEILSVNQKKIILYAIWTPKDDIEYLVCHFFENIEDDLFTEDEDLRETLYGKNQDQTEAAARKVDGFTVLEFDQKTIDFTNKTVINIYYKRNEITISFDTNGGSSINPIKGKYEAKIEVPDQPVKENYYFTGYNPPIPATFPSKDLLCVAQWNLHVHTYSETWEKNETYHWHAATCEHKDEVSNKNEHTWDDGVITKDADCMNKGNKIYTCTSCKFTKNETIPTKSHTEDEGTVTTDSTCTTDGVRTFKCTVCKQQLRTETVPATGHTEDKGTVTTDPTCTTDGVKTFNCTVCKQQLRTETVSATGHTEDKGTVTTDPTCTTYGVRTFKCTVCKQQLRTETVPATGHTYNANYVCSCGNVKELTVGEFISAIGTSVTTITADSTKPGITFTSDHLSVNVSNVKLSGNFTTSVKFPTTLTSANISGIDYTNVTATSNMFRGNPNLLSVTLPDTINTLGEYSFRDCSSLSTLTIPESVTGILNYAFYGCTNLKNIVIPNTVKEIGISCFSGCAKLTNITLPDTISEIKKTTFQNCTSLASITLPSSIKIIGDSAFTGCSSLSEINIPNGVTSIGTYTFHNCTSLSSIIIPDSVQTINQYAFRACSNLTTISFGTGLKVVEAGAFELASQLTRINITDLDKWAVVVFNGTNSNPMLLNNASLYCNDSLVPDYFYDSESGHCYLSAWTNNETNHWHDTICDHNKTINLSKHDWDSGVIYPETVESEKKIINTCNTCKKTKETTYSRTKYSISYNNITDATNENITNYTIADNVILNNPTKQDYIFAGWYTDSSFTNKFVSQWTAGEYSTNLTLYAKWLSSKLKNSTGYQLVIDQSELTEYIGISGKLRLVVEERNNANDRIIFKYGNKNDSVASTVPTAYANGEPYRYTTTFEMNDVTIDGTSEFKIYREVYYSSSGWTKPTNYTCKFTLYFEQ